MNLSVSSLLQVHRFARMIRHVSSSHTFKHTSTGTKGLRGLFYGSALTLGTFWNIQIPSIDPVCLNIYYTQPETFYIHKHIIDHFLFLIRCIVGRKHSGLAVMKFG